MQMLSAVRAMLTLRVVMEMVAELGSVVEREPGILTLLHSHIIKDILIC